MENHSIWRLPARLVLAICTVIVGVGMSAAAAAAEKGQAASDVPAVQRDSDALVAFVQQVNQSLGLTSSRIITLNIDMTPDVPVNTPISIGEDVYTLSLLPHSVRAPGYRLQAQIADGSYIDVDPGPVRTLRGSLLEVPGSMAAGGLLEDGLHVVVHLPDGQKIWTEPLTGRVAGAMANEYVQYRGEDVICPEGACGVDAAFLQAFPPAVLPDGEGGVLRGDDGGAVFCAEVACDADFEFYQTWGSSITNVQDRINLVLSTMNLQYINQVSIQHVITHIIVRTAEPDPYTSTNASTLLGQFQSHWNNTQGGIPRDMAHLFTGKNLDGTTIGIAFVGVVCTTSAYGLVQNNNNFSCATDLSAHEMGHNWNASHCSGTCSSTMNSGLMCVNTFFNSNPSSVDQIVAFRNSRPCLSACADASLPFFEDFPSTTFDSGKWTTLVGATISTVGINEPSAPNSMRLRGSSTGGNEARTSRIDASSLGVLELEYYYQRRGGGDQPEPGDDLIVEFFDENGNWVEVSRQFGNGPAMTTYLPASVSFPSNALHSEFRVRFRVSSFQTNLDDWFVDDISITGAAQPVNDNCSNSLFASAGSHPFSTLASSTDGPNEPALCNFNGNTNIENDIWFTHVSSCTGTTTVSVCGANFNSKIAIYTGACPSTSGNALACDDDFCGAGGASQVSFPTNQGQIRRIRIGGVNGATGSGTLVISCVPSTPPCPADTNGDGQINVTDLLTVINAWGPCPAPCSADGNNDGQVDVTDLLGVINAWGPC